jgi:hypothetical protein
VDLQALLGVSHQHSSGARERALFAHVSAVSRAEHHTTSVHTKDRNIRITRSYIYMDFLARENAGVELGAARGVRLLLLLLALAAELAHF